MLDLDALGEQSGRIQVLITSWGCPPIDRAVVTGMPGLKLIAHLAGSVKGFIEDSVWRMGIQITNAVAAKIATIENCSFMRSIVADSPRGWDIKGQPEKRVIIARKNG